MRDIPTTKFRLGWLFKGLNPLILKVKKSNAEGLYPPTLCYHSK